MLFERIAYEQQFCEYKNLQLELELSKIVEREENTKNDTQHSIRYLRFLLFT